MCLLIEIKEVIDNARTSPRKGLTVNHERRKGRAVCRSERRSIPSEWLLRPNDSSDSDSSSSSSDDGDDNEFDDGDSDDDDDQDDDDDDDDDGGDDH